MENILYNNDLLSELLISFHDSVELNEEQLGKIEHYLFYEQPLVMEFVTVGLKRTLEYLKEVISEEGLKEINTLVQHFVDADNQAEKEFIETFTSTDNELDKTDDCLDIDWRRQINNDVDFSFFHNGTLFLAQTKLTPITTFRDCLKVQDLNWNVFEQKVCQIFTMIHSTHFADLEKYASVFFLSGKSYRSIESMTVQKLWDYFEANENYRCYSNNARTAFIKKLDRHYDELIEQLAKEQPIFSEAFKLALTEWFLFSKFETIHTRQFQSCVLMWNDFAIEEYQDILYRNFSEIAKSFYYIQFSNKEWIILKSPDGHSWLTTEDPGFSVNLDEFVLPNKPLNPDSKLANLDNNSIIYFPLSKDYCLRIQPKLDSGEINEEPEIYPVQFKSSTEIEFRTINEMTISTGKEMVISANRETLEQFADI